MKTYLIVPVLVRHGQAGPTQPLSGLMATAPQQGREADKEHVTNIWRMEALLEQHPEVDSVTRVYKQPDTSVFNTDGRCGGHKGDGHQSPFDLRVTLVGATGANMKLGCGVNRIKADSIAL